MTGQSMTFLISAKRLDAKVRGDESSQNSDFNEALGSSSFFDWLTEKIKTILDRLEDIEVKANDAAGLSETNLEKLSQDAKISKRMTIGVSIISIIVAYFLTEVSDAFWHDAFKRGLVRLSFYAGYGFDHAIAWAKSMIWH